MSVVNCIQRRARDINGMIQDLVSLAETFSDASERSDQQIIEELDNALKCLYRAHDKLDTQIRKPKNEDAEHD